MDHARSDIQLTNSDLTVTRTNSSGWGCVFFNEPFTHGTYEVKIHIDNDGGSDSLYIGIFKTPENDDWPTTNRINSDQQSCVWKRNGEFFNIGSSTRRREMKYTTGDEMTFTIDMDEKNMKMWKNEEEAHTFDFTWESVTFVACFGGSNQHFTVSSVLASGNSPSVLSGKTVKIASD
jgi:hypothetical protein